MMPTPQKWLKWAKRFMPIERAEWLAAMEAELSDITNENERRYFAIGCFKAAVFEYAHSRRGLHYIARAIGAFFIFMMSFMAIIMNAKLGAFPETVGASKLIMGLCIIYMLASVLFLLSLKGLQIYACIGLSFTISGWAYFHFVRPKFETLPVEFLTALSVEASGIMASLLLATVYLNLLYAPRSGNA